MFNNEKMMIRKILNVDFSRQARTVIFALFAFIGLQSSLMATHYRTKADGNWNLAANWESSDDGVSNWGASFFPPAGATDDTITIRNNMTIDVDVSIDETSIENDKTLTVGTGVTLTIANGIGDDLIVNGSLVVKGTLAINAGVITGNSASYQSGATLKYSATQTSTNAEFPASGVVNLNIADNVTLTLNSSKTISGNTSIGTNAVFTLDNNDFTLGGDLETGKTFNAGTATVSYNGNSAQQIAAYTYNNLAFAGDGAKTLPTELTVSGNISKSGNCSITVGTGKVILSGANQSISGNMSFYDLEKIVTSAATLTIEAGSTQTISGSLTLTGAESNLLSLRSSSTGNTWSLDTSAASVRLLNYLNVQDSIALNRKLYAVNSTNAGNNQNWLFSRPIFYADAARSADGSSWENATGDLKGLMSDCTDLPADIWVKAGVYKANARTPANKSRTQYFTLPNHISIYGGFSDTATTFYERDPASNHSILSGDLDSDDRWVDNWAGGADQGLIVSSNAFVSPQTKWLPNKTLMDDNTYHVLVTQKCDSNTVIDGLIITGGCADGANPKDIGGGIYATLDSEPTIKNTLVAGNYSSKTGAGIYSSYKMALESSTIQSNCIKNFLSASPFVAKGAGIYSDEYLSIKNCLIDSNFASDTSATSINLSGGGVYCEEILTGSGNTISNNFLSAYARSTSSSGGGIYCADDQLTLTNSTIIGNQAASGADDMDGSATSAGGGVFVIKDNNASQSLLINCTLTSNIVKNTGSIDDMMGWKVADGGGVKAASSNRFFAINCLFRDNSAPQTSLAGQTAIYSFIPDYAGAESTINTGDPLLDSSLKDNGGETATIAILENSPAINAGVKVYLDSDKTPYYEDPASAGTYKKVIDHASYTPTSGTVQNIPDDQRGYFRNGAVDIGAYEYDGTNSTNFRYRTVAAGNWHDKSVWEASSDGTTWYAAETVPTFLNGKIQIFHALAVSVNLTVDQAVIDTNGAITIDSGVTLTVNDGEDYYNGDLTLYNGNVINNGTLQNNGTLTIADGVVTGNTVQYASSSTLRYWNRNVAGVTSNVEFPTNDVPNLEIRSLSNLTLNESKKVSGNVHLDSFSFDLNNFDLEIGCNGSPTLSCNADHLNGGNGRIIYNSNSPQTIASVPYHHLVFKGSGEKILPSEINVSGELINTDNCAITVGTCETLLDGANQSLSGNLSFYTLKKSVTAAGTLTVQAGSTITVTGELLLNGESGNLLSLRSSQAGSSWNLDANNSTQRTLFYLDVKDSTSVTRKLYAGSSTDSGNNVNWIFNSSPLNFVDAENGNNSNDGKSWDTAKQDLAALLNNLQDLPAEIWVAKGVYKPGANQADYFTLKPQMSIYGGFAGGETSRDQRDPAQNQTILSGDLNGDDQWIDKWGDAGNGATQQGLIISNASMVKPSVGWIADRSTQTDNSYRVVNGNYLDSNDVFDGFILTGSGGTVNVGVNVVMKLYKSSIRINDCIFLASVGYGVDLNSTQSLDTNATISNCQFLGSNGYSIKNSSNGLTINDCEFTGNLLTSVYLYSSTASINRTVFNDNYSTSRGGAIYITNCASHKVSIIDSSFSRNTCEDNGALGGAISSGDLKELLINRCVFDSNEAKGIDSAYGGAIHTSESLKEFTLINSTFYKNSAAATSFSKGGVLYCSADKSIIENCTFATNRVTGTDTLGGAIYNRVIQEQYLSNNIFWGNTTDQIANENGLNPILLNCIVQDGYTGTTTNLITNDPLLDSSLKDNGGETKTLATLAGTPTLDAGVKVYLDTDAGKTLYYFDPDTSAYLKVVDNSSYSPVNGSLVNGNYDQRKSARLARPDIGAYERGTTVVLTMQATPESAGTITPAIGQHNVATTPATALTATPDDSKGYEFDTWSITPASNGTLATPTSSTCQLNLTDSATVTANFKLKQYSVNFSAGTGGTLTGTASQTIEHGSSSTAVTAAPGTGYKFVKWSNDSTDNPITLTNITADITLSATFELKTYTVQFVAGSNGYLTGDATQTVSHGSNASSVTAVPAVGYQFVKWSNDSTDNPITLSTVINDTTLTANFEIKNYLVQFNDASNGTLTGEKTQTIEHGGTATTVTAVANTGYKFVKWSNDSTENPLTLKDVSDNVTLSPVFEILTYTVQFNEAANGTLTGEKTQTIQYGASSTSVTATPSDGYLFVKWSDGSTDNPITLSNVTADITLSPVFEIKKYTVQFTVDENGSLSGDAKQTIDYGGSATAVTAVPGTGYLFVKWSNDSTDNPITLTNVTADIALSPVFALKTYTVLFNAGTNGSLSGETTQTIGHGATCSAVTATPDDGYHFAGWSNGLTDNPLTLSNVTESQTLTASFTDLSVSVSLSLKASPEAAGTVSHNGNAELYVGTIVMITASPVGTYQFSHWNVDGNIILADQKSATTTAILHGSGTATAYFTSPELKSTLTMQVSPADSGAVTPDSGEHSTGSFVAISASPSSGYTFLEWELTGDAVITNSLSSDTYLTLTGDATVTAVFSEETDDTSVQVTLSISDNNGGTTNPESGTYTMKINATQDIQATCFSGFGFSHWESSENILVDEPDSAKTSFTVLGTGTVEAVYASAAEFKHKARVMIRKTNMKENADFISITGFETSHTEFDIEKDSLVIKVDDSLFKLSSDEGTFKQKKQRVQYVSNDKTLSFKLDFKKGLWFFKAKKITIDKIDNSDGVDVVLRINNELSGDNLFMQEKISWKYKGVNEDDGFQILKAGGSYCAGALSVGPKSKSSTIAITSAKLADDFTFNPASDSITLTIDDFSRKLEAGTGVEKGDRITFVDKEEKLILQLDLVKQLWKFKTKSLKVNDNINLSDKVDIVIETNSGKSEETINALYKQQLNYKR